MISHGFMVQIIYTMAFPELNNLRLWIQLFNCLTWKCGINITIQIHHYFLQRYHFIVCLLSIQILRNPAKFRSIKFTRVMTGWNYFVLLLGQKSTNIWHIYVSPSNEGRHIVLVWFFLPLPHLLLLLSKACTDHNFFVFQDRSMIFGLWVHDHNAVCCVP